MGSPGRSWGGAIPDLGYLSSWDWGTPAARTSVSPIQDWGTISPARTGAPPSPCGQTDTCENSTFPSFGAGGNYISSEILLCLLQWRIQDFPEEGTPTPRWGTNLLFGQKCPENCMKMKEFGPLRSANELVGSSQRYLIDGIEVAS